MAEEEDRDRDQPREDGLERMMTRNLERDMESLRSNEPASATPEDVRRRMKKRLLYRAAMEGDWDAAKKIFYSDSDLKTARLNCEGMTALHVAANCGKSEFVEKLVSNLNQDELQMRDQIGRNALHHVALASSVGAAKAIVIKDQSLAQVKEVYHYTPLFYAARWRHPSKSKEMLDYLYDVTNKENVFNDPETASNLIVAITASGCHDVALKVLEKHPELALTVNLAKWSILHILASQPSSFHSGNKTSIWEKKIYPWMNFVSPLQKMHNDALQLVHFVCKELLKKSDGDIMDYFLPKDQPAILHLATRHGVFELVQVCIKYFPDLIWYSSDRGKLLIHVAVKHRRIKIFNHIMQLIGQNAGAYAAAELEGDNNILHLAANLAPTPQLHSVPGPAFQMQREFQWFKAVESLVYREQKVAKNKDGKAPIDLFFEEHEKLIDNAKEWIKDTSNSCMVVAALVATVAFASMITVPGGNDSGTGLPIFSKKEVFIVFSVSNALSMITSAIALLMFLSLQTSRFTAEDFLMTLPKNMLRGLLSLFVAVATMMIAFGTAIGMALQTRVNWAYIPITIVACIPAIIFTKLQLPLLFQTVVVTSGPLILRQERDRKLWCLDKFSYTMGSAELI